MRYRLTLPTASPSTRSPKRPRPAARRRRHDRRAALRHAGIYLLPVKLSTKHAGSVVGNGWRKSSRDPKQIVAWFAGTDHGSRGTADAPGSGRSTPTITTLRPTCCSVIWTRRRFRPPAPTKTRSAVTTSSACRPGASSATAPDDSVKRGATSAEKTGSSSCNPTQTAGAGCAPGRRRLPDELAELLDDASSADDAASDAEVRRFWPSTPARPGRPSCADGSKR